MGRPLEVWGAVIIPPLGVKAKKNDGRRAAQVRGVVRTSSRAAAARAMGVTSSWLKEYGSTSGNEADLTACAAFLDNTLLLRGLDPGDTIDGNSGYVEWHISD